VGLDGIAQVQDNRQPFSRTYHSAKMFEYAKLLSTTGEMKYIGTCDRLQVSMWAERHSKRSKVTPVGKHGTSTLPPFLSVSAAKRNVHI
jgi:hypothetical protein